MALATALSLLHRAAPGQGFEGEPIHYATAPVDDPVARLQARIDRGEVRLEHDGRHGYLAAVLRELGIPASSQALVFSKTSFQRELIGPSTPRAIYFTDDAYIGWVRGGEVVEVASVDPRQGTIFYTLDQDERAKPRFERRNAECLQCHASPLTRSVPGLLVRSVYPDPQGLPVLKAGTFNTDHSSPLRERWGGWYVTGTHGAERHLGNAFLSDPGGDPAALDGSAGANVTSLAGRFDAAPYLTPHSDLVALLVLEHQVQLHDLIASASYQARIAMHQQAAMASLTGDPPDRPNESTLRRFEYASTPLLKYLLLVDEAPLGAPVRGTSAFAEDFQRRGPRDARGRSLRDLDLERRLFRYPCSFLIYSEAFDGLPAHFKEHLYGRLRDILTGKDSSKDFARLSAEDRRAVLEILLETKPGLPCYWREAQEGGAGARREARL
ncbi:MAG: hypothetical protein HY721_07630 [Planctomycetes bacterium]|nr:hypothetical protein [Planctomycetota bacterium]